MLIVGLDISSTRTGVSIVDEYKKIIYCDVINLTSSKLEDIFDKICEVEKQLKKLFSQYKPDKVFIETALNNFQRGKTSAQTIGLLLKFNGMVSLLVKQITGLKPEYIGATAARRMNGIKIPKGSIAKQIVIKHLLDTDPTFKVEYTPKGNISPKNFDMADSLVIARAGVECLKKK